MQLTRDALTAAADVLGVEEAVLKAVVEIEAAGSGFDAEGRPKILFEPHIFERELNTLGYPDDGEHVQWARQQRIASPKWDRALYPKTADGRWAQIELAFQIAPEAAYRSTSFGLPQIMGFNHKAAGFETVTDLVAAMCENEGRQLLAMVAFIQKSGMDDELRAKNWAAFARLYNGPAYAQNQYDAKLRKAYEKHVRDPEAFWHGKANNGHGPAAGQEYLVAEGVDV